MADTLSRAERSERMSRIRGRNTRPELVLRKLLHSAGFRYRLHDAGLPGQPDLVLRKYKAVIFVHGCFWHRHAGCRVANMPKSNVAFWTAKFERNVARDATVESALRADGWRVLVVWECSLSTKERAAATADQVVRWLRDSAGAEATFA
jgi:DNA mismatch endonuclease, patch repair protein